MADEEADDDVADEEAAEEAAEEEAKPKKMTDKKMTDKKKLKNLLNDEGMGASPVMSKQELKELKEVVSSVMMEKTLVTIKEEKFWSLGSQNATISMTDTKKMVHHHRKKVAMCTINIGPLSPKACDAISTRFMKIGLINYVLEKNNEWFVEYVMMEGHGAQAIQDRLCIVLEELAKDGVFVGCSNILSMFYVKVFACEKTKESVKQEKKQKKDEKDIEKQMKKSNYQEPSRF